jgi:hypothetical protein
MAICSLGSICSYQTKTARSVNTAPAVGPEGIGGICTIHITPLYQNTTSHFSLDCSVDGSPVDNPTKMRGGANSSVKGGGASSPVRGGGANLSTRGCPNSSTRGGLNTKEEESIQYSEYNLQEESVTDWLDNLKNRKNSYMSAYKLCGSATHRTKNCKVLQEEEEESFVSNPFPTAKDVKARLGTQDTKIAELSSGIEQIKALLTDRSSTPSNLSHSAVPAGLPIKKVVYDDREMVTSPVIYTVGSTVYWKYGESLWKDVKIIEVIAPSATRIEPVYTVAFGEHSDVVRHDQLFIESGMKTKVIQGSVIDSAIGNLPIAYQLHVSIMSDKNPRKVKMYNAMDNKSFKWSTFKTTMESLYLADDKLGTLKDTYDSIKFSTLTSGKAALHFLDLKELSPEISIIDIMKPPNDYPLKSQAMSFLQNFGDIVKKALFTQDSAKDAPIARCHLHAIRHIKGGGLVILYGLLTKRFPYLGAIDFDGYD